MKEIKAIIRPNKLLDVVSELQKIEGLPGVMICDIRGFGKSKAKNAPDKFTDGPVSYIKRVQIEVVVSDEMVDTVVHTIQVNAHTGNTGDGKIFICTVEDVVKIRTNERGLMAI